MIFFQHNFCQTFALQTAVFKLHTLSQIGLNSQCVSHQYALIPVLLLQLLVGQLHLVEGHVLCDVTDDVI